MGEAQALGESEDSDPIWEIKEGSLEEVTVKEEDKLARLREKAADPDSVSGRGSSLSKGWAVKMCI